MPGVPRESAVDENDRTHRRGAAGVSRSAFAAVSELHRLPPEDSRKLRGQESAAMKRLPFRIRQLDASRLLAQTPRAGSLEQPRPRPRRPPPQPRRSRRTSTVSPDTSISAIAGYTGVYGSSDTYRSIVDLGSGPKMLGTEFTILGSEEAPLRPHRRARVRLGRRSLFHAACRRDAKRSSTISRAITATSPTTTICPAFADPLL